MRARLALAFALAAASIDVACADTPPPRGQLLLYVTTDAPLPPPPGETLRPDEPTPLFDRVRIDVLVPGGDAPCDGCSREFEIDRAQVDAGRASIGLVTVQGVPGYRARVRLLRGAAERDGEPAPDSTIDVTVALPVVVPDTITEVTVTLSTDDVGHPLGGDAPLAPTDGPPQPGLVGTWPGATRVPCPGAAPPGYACIPGGVYWMGNPLVQGIAALTPQDPRQRLVVLSPFFMKTTEVSVAEYRAANPGVDVPIDNPGCTFHRTDAAMPLDCIDWQSARDHCRKVGADLPTEAQFEYAASGLRGDLYVWGTDDPTCKDATFARVVQGQMCTALGDSPTHAGAGARDRLDPGTGDPAVVDLAGNLSEWTLDDWEPVGGRCWGAGVLHDPLCRSNAATGLRPLRGGSFLTEPGFLRAAVRQGSTTTGALDVGFRCARPAL